MSVSKRSLFKCNDINLHTTTHSSICSFLLKLRRLNGTNEMHCSKAIQLNGKFNSSFLINHSNIANHMKGLKAAMTYHNNIICSNLDKTSYEDGVVLVCRIVIETNRRNSSF